MLEFESLPAVSLKPALSALKQFRLETVFDSSYTLKIRHGCVCLDEHNNQNLETRCFIFDNILS